MFVVGDFSFLILEDLSLKLSKEVTLWGVSQEQHSRVGEPLGILVGCHVVLKVLQLSKVQ